MSPLLNKKQGEEKEHRQRPVFGKKIAGERTEKGNVRLFLGANRLLLSLV